MSVQRFWDVHLLNGHTLHIHVSGPMPAGSPLLCDIETAHVRYRSGEAARTTPPVGRPVAIPWSSVAYVSVPEAGSTSCDCESVVAHEEVS